MKYTPYKLYKHRFVTNKWLVVRSPADIQADYIHVYDVDYTSDGKTQYTEIKVAFF